MLASLIALLIRWLEEDCHSDKLCERLWGKLGREGSLEDSFLDSEIRKVRIAERGGCGREYFRAVLPVEEEEDDGGGPLDEWLLTPFGSDVGGADCENAHGPLPWSVIASSVGDDDDAVLDSGVLEDAAARAPLAACVKLAARVAGNSGRLIERGE